MNGFNTVNGKYCCNLFLTVSKEPKRRNVSIPQAVSAVATKELNYKEVYVKTVSIPQAVSAVATAGARKSIFMRVPKVVLENLKP